MIKKRDLLISLVFALTFTVTLVLAHSLVVFFYAIAGCMVILGGYVSLLGCMYKNKYIKMCILQQSRKKKSSFADMWQVGLIAVGMSICFIILGFSFQENPENARISIFNQAVLSAIAGFFIGFCFSIGAWWLWRQYLTVINSLP